MAYTLVPTELIQDGAVTSAKLDTNIAISGTLSVGGVTTLATHLVMGDNDKIKIGAGGDLEIYHDASNSYIANSTGNLYIGDTNGSVHVQAKLNEDSIVAAADGAVTLYYDNAPKLATSSAGVTVTGALAATLSTAAQTNITSVGTLSALTVTGEITANGGIALGDSDKATFGAGDDLQIYHDGGNSVITNSTGNLIIRDSVGGNILIQGLQNQPSIDAIANGAVNLYYSGNARLATTSTGIDVTGTATMDALTVDGIIALTDSGSSNRNILYLDGSDNVVLATGTTAGARGIDLYTNNNKSLSVAESGDISFYEDTGSTAKLFWDASAERLGIGTTSPSAKLDIQMSDANGAYGRGIDGNLNLENTNTSVTEGGWLSISGYMGNAAQSGQYQMGAITGGKQTTAADGTYGGYLSLWTTSGGGNGEANSGMYERVRIDGSGSLLLGKTATNTDSVGFEARATGLNAMVRDAGETLVLGRNTSDGNILSFRKDGTAVGSIGTVASRLFIGNDDTFLTFQGASDRIYPASSSGGARDAAIDLGLAGGRFRDLYLSGGVVFDAVAGNATSNTLDDYEEGTYTATISCASGSISLNTSFDELRYTKIGNLVHVQGRLACSGVSNPTGATNLNLPFTSINDTNKSGVADNLITGYFNGSAVTNGIYTVYGNIDESSTNCRLFIMVIPATHNLGDNYMAGGSDLYVNFTYTAA